MSVFRNLMAHLINMEGDWRVALVEIIHPTNVKIYYTPKTPYNRTPVTRRGNGAGLVVRLEDSSDNAKFDAGEYITTKSILMKLERGTETKKEP